MQSAKRILGFTALMIATFLGTLDSTITTIALPDMTSYFGTSINDTSWISTIYVLSLSVFMITASKMADQFGRKRWILVGLSLFGLSSFLCGLANSFLLLIMLRFIQGIGAAIITPIGLPMGLEILGKDRRQFVVGSAGAMISIAAASGPPLGGWLMQLWGWRSIFWVNIPLCILAIVLSIFFVKESYDPTVSKSIDWLGMLLLTGSLFSLTFALLKGTSFGWDSAFTVSMFVAAILTTALFLVVERRVANPMLELKLFRELTFTASSLCYMMVGFGITSTMVIFNYFLENLLGYSALSAACLIITLSLASAVAVPSGSRIAKHTGTRPINFLGVFFMGIGVLLLSRLTVHATKIQMIEALLVFGTGLGFAGQSIASAIKFLPQEKSGIASGVINAFRQLGTCIGVAVLVSMLGVHRMTAASHIQTIAIANITQQAELDEFSKNKLIQKLQPLSGTEPLSASDIQAIMEDDTRNRLEAVPVLGQSVVLEQLHAEQTAIHAVAQNLNHAAGQEQAQAFSKTFLWSGIVLLIMSGFGLFTDRKHTPLETYQQ
jgi:EmrB/QacA subfamily drug resistance transporter